MASINVTASQDNNPSVFSLAGLFQQAVSLVGTFVADLKQSNDLVSLNDSYAVGRATGEKIALQYIDELRDTTRPTGALQAIASSMARNFESATPQERSLKDGQIDGFFSTIENTLANAVRFSRHTPELSLRIKQLAPAKRADA
jgi:hypothetical protein